MAKNKTDDYFLDKLRSDERHNETRSTLKTCHALLRRGMWGPVWSYAMRTLNRAQPECQYPVPVMQMNPKGIACLTCGAINRTDAETYKGRVSEIVERMDTEDSLWESIPIEHLLPRDGTGMSIYQRCLEILRQLDVHLGDRHLAAHAANIFRAIGPFAGFILDQKGNKRLYKGNQTLPTDERVVPNPLPYFVFAVKVAYPWDWFYRLRKIKGGRFQYRQREGNETQEHILSRDGVINGLSSFTWLESHGVFQECSSWAVCSYSGRVLCGINCPELPYIKAPRQCQESGSKSS